MTPAAKFIDLCCMVHSCWIFCGVALISKIRFTDTFSKTTFLWRSNCFLHWSCGIGYIWDRLTDWPTRPKSCRGSHNNIHGPCHGPMSLGERYGARWLKIPMARKPFQGPWFTWGKKLDKFDDFSALLKRIGTLQKGGDEAYRHINQIRFALASWEHRMQPNSKQSTIHIVVVQGFFHKEYSEI